jgi:hypothetical protein
MTSTPLHVARLSLAFAIAALSPVSVWAAAKPAKFDKTERKEAREASVDLSELKFNKREVKASARGESENAPNPEARQLTRLRDRLEVKDDAEWAVIAERISKVEERRHNLAGGLRTGGGVPAATAGEKVKRAARAGSSGNAEFDALRAAVADQYPDAEIKAQLARAHEAHQQREAQLLKAQAELRAVLSVRQEAILVMFGLLPP